MRAIVLCFALLSFFVNALDCNDNTVYAKLSMQTSAYAEEEIFEIYDGTVLLYRSPLFEDHELRVIELCLNATTNNQYTLKLIDDYGDSWTSGSHLTVEALYGNIVFKNYMIEDEVETYSVSLYYGVMKNAQVKLTSGSVTGTWTAYDYDDTEWSEVTLGSVTTPVSGNQFIRKQFVSLPNMAAYEISLKYRFGIVVYLNGVEILRDNMPEGEITPTTLAAGGYTSINYHTYMRPGAEVNATQTVLAVALHYMTEAGASTVDFDCYLALLSPTSEESCFIYPYEMIITSTAGYNPSSAFDFGRDSSLYISSPPQTVTYTVQGPRPYVNGFRIFPSSRVNAVPMVFTVEGAFSSTDPTWYKVMDINGLVYTEKTHKFVNGYFNANTYSVYRTLFTASDSSSVTVYEFQPLICSVTLPSGMTFPQESYSFYAKYEEVSISPSLNEFTNCTISPAPMEGLTFDATTCTLSGKVMTPQAATTYTVTSTMKGAPYSGSFTITITGCTGTLVNVLRTYKSSAYREAFQIKNASTQEVVFSVVENSDQPANKDWSVLVCLIGTKFIVSTSSSYTYWTSNSHLYINALLDGIDDYETIIRTRYDTNLGIPNDHTFNVDYLVSAYETWHYKMGAVPTNWYNSDMSDWSTGTAGSYPESSNQIQLYKKTFNVASLTDVSGVVLSIKYQYGLLIYLNNHEVFRLGVSGALSTDSYSSVNLENANYRQISLPVKTIAFNNTASVDYIVQGTNTIAIAVVGLNPTTKTSTFDCAVRLIGVESMTRSFDTTVTGSGVSGSFRDILNEYCGNNFYYSTCSANSLDIVLNDHRHEWISSLSVGLSYSQVNQHFRQFVFKAKNEDDEEWTTLIDVKGLTFSLVGQKNRIWLQNNKAYNMFRFENFGTGDSSNCRWQVGHIDLKCDAINVQVPNLSYETPTVTIYKDIEMAEVYPSSYHYRDFSVTPSLPDGVHLDPYTGTISGTAHTLESSQTYTINAYTFTGTPVSTTVSIAVEVCTSGRSLITLVARTDSSPSQGSYKVYEGKGTTGTVKYSIDSFIVPSGLNYGDFCLNHGIYTLEMIDSSSGWSNPAGWWLTIDIGEMKFDSGYVYNNNQSPVSITTLFSSFLPFQIEYDDWKVYKDTIVVTSDWNTVDFDDSTWSVTKAADIGTSEAVTVYIRRDIQIPDIADYHVLNVRVKYAGGIVAYFNGRKVARFNLVEDFEATTESIEVHDASTFSQFHVVLPTVGAVTGKNVIAFEVHRPLGQSSAEPVVFEATGIFGVNDCSIAVDTVTDISGTAASSAASLEKYFDISTVDYGNMINSIGSNVLWTVENLEGTRFNSYAVNSIYDRHSIGFSVYGRVLADEEWTSMFADPNVSTIKQARTSYSIPVGIASFRHFKWELDKTGNGAFSISSMFFQYCKASGEGTCPGVGDYPAVGEGEISPGVCPDGYRGYSYRECSNNVLGEIKTDKCEQKLPSKLSYDTDRYTLVKDTSIAIHAPTYLNIIEKFYLAENEQLPTGLILDEVTGAITGIPTEVIDFKTFKIYGENKKGVTSTEISLSVRVGECKAEGNFPKTTVGNTAVYECSNQGSYVGTQKRACKLGAQDGEWQKLEGTCILISLLVTLIAIAIIVVVVIVYFVIRVSRRKKAVGGVKGKKKPEVSKTEKKAVKKDIKV